MLTNPPFGESYLLFIDALGELSVAFVYERSEMNDHFMRLWKRMLSLAKSVGTLADKEDGPACEIVLRAQLEVFSRLQFFLVDAEKAWKSERASVLNETLSTQKHFQDYPTLPYSINVQLQLDQLRGKWPDILFNVKNGKYEGAKTIRGTFKSVAESGLTSMSAYGLYKFLCGESHSGMLHVAARHARQGPSDGKTNPLQGEGKAAMKISAWLLGQIAERFLDDPSLNAAPQAVIDARRLLEVTSSA